MAPWLNYVCKIFAFIAILCGIIFWLSDQSSLPARLEDAALVRDRTFKTMIA